ncbi:hypothetical protein ACFYNO_29535 [Kitasatospora sp. NPDC006697]|uniref:hypothetical protein n=1 Tax=Kitasatospora sp. NPDC006697 TaxID=3364020 RepID=UPI00369F42CC
MTTGETERQPASGDSQQLARVRAELERLASEAAAKSRHARQRARFWAAADVAVGLPAVVLATLSGATGLASSDARIPAALLALIAASLSAAGTYMRSDVRHTRAHRRKNAWRVLEDAARIAVIRDSYADTEHALAVLARLYEMRAALFAGRYDDVLS